MVWRPGWPTRRKIAEFLLTWLGVQLSVGSIDRCIREVGVACEPVAEELLEEVRTAGIIHAEGLSGISCAGGLFHLIRPSPL